MMAAVVQAVLTQSEDRQWRLLSFCFIVFILEYLYSRICFNVWNLNLKIWKYRAPLTPIVMFSFTVPYDHLIAN